MKNLSLIALFSIAGHLPLPAADLPRSQPEAQGVDSAALLAFVCAADKKLDSLHSLMVVRHGNVIAEGWWAPYHPRAPHSLFSLSKSFTSTAIGIAIAEGKLNLDDEVLKFFPEEAPAQPSANLKAMRISDLLRMSTGHDSEPPRTSGQSWVKSFLAYPVPFKPGTHFLYNTSATYICSAIVQKATGQTLLDYLKPRLFEPLGIDSPTWEKSPQGISTGGYGLSLRTEDIAKFGQLYLQKGKWNGKQLVPEAWIEAATARQTSNGSNPKSDWDQGYGYQFWRCRNGAYRGDGAFGQYCIVLPEQDTVIAITSGLKDMQAVLNLVWESLPPAMHSGALPPNEMAVKQLDKTLKRLSLAMPEGTGSASKSVGKKFEFPENHRKLESVALKKIGEEGAMAIVARFAGKEQEIICGLGEWARSQSVWDKTEIQIIAAAGAWTSPDTYTAKICFRETPFVQTFQFQFAGDELKLDVESNVGFGATKQPTLTGKLSFLSP